MSVDTPPSALENLERLKPLKDRRDQAAIFLDLDGTLCEIVDAPEAVQMSPIVRGHLTALSEMYGDVVITSGRAASALVRIVRIPSITYVGNHGLEVIEGGERRILLPEEVAERMRSVGEALRTSINCEGALIELKELSHAIHYRRSRNPEETKECILGELSKLDLEGTRLTEGKMLVQIRPEYPLDKGKTLELLVREKGIELILYAGDDTTDMDAFRSISRLTDAGALQGYKVVVLHADTPADMLRMSDFEVDGVEQMQRLLGWLAS